MATQDFTTCKNGQKRYMFTEIKQIEFDMVDCDYGNKVYVHIIILNNGDAHLFRATQTIRFAFDSIVIE